MQYTNLAEFRNTVLKALGENGALQGVSFDFSDNRYLILPGFADVHVHLREPGFFYKESIATGTAAAAHGGYTAVCSMPNLDPVPDCLEHLQPQLKAIQSHAAVNVFPFGAITVGEQGKTLADMAAMAPFVAGFSDDGRGVQSEELMKTAMLTAKALGKPIVAHCEDNTLVDGGYIHAGEYARAHGHRGIVSESEWRPIERDIALVRQTGCAYHVCHVSAKESVELIRKAKAEGLDITCETAPHYLVLDDSMLQEDGRFKMNPPLRSRADREALVAGIQDGTIDMIATDHAPHSAEEKAKGLRGSLMGVVGLECAFPILYTYLVKTGTIPLETLVRLMSVNPRRRFALPVAAQDFCVWDAEAETRVCPAEFLSKGKSTPFEGYAVNGVCKLTVCNGKTAYCE